MDTTTDARKGDEIITAFNCRKDGSCRQLLKQVNRGGEQVLLENRYFLAGTMVDMESGEILSGPGEAKKWTDAFTRRELASILFAQAKQKIQNIARGH